MNDPVNYVDLDGLQSTAKKILDVLNQLYEANSTVQSNKDIIKYLSKIDANSSNGAGIPIDVQLRLSEIHGILNTTGVIGIPLVIKKMEMLEEQYPISTANNSIQCNDNGQSKNKNSRNYDDPTDDWYFKGMQEWNKYVKKK